MKKIFLAKRNALLSSTDISWGVWALVCVVFLLLLRLLAPNFFWYMFTPVFRSADALATNTHSFFSSFNNSAQLTLQNEKLQDENAALALENQALLQKMASFDALLGPSAGGKYASSGLIASVVARPPESPYDTLVLARGARDGVAIGQGAFGAGGVPLGIVSAVSTDFSRVTLFSSSGIRTNGWVGRANIPITLAGSGAGVMSASLARSAAVTAGDTVFGPGQLPIGKVTRVDSDPSTSSVTLRITPALNMFSVTWVLLRDTGSIRQGIFPQL